MAIQNKMHLEPGTFQYNHILELYQRASSNCRTIMYTLITLRQFFDIKLVLTCLYISETVPFPLMSLGLLSYHKDLRKCQQLDQ